MPAAIAVTVALTVQLAPEASVALVRRRSVAPEVTCHVEPVQVLVVVPSNTIICPGAAGNVSAKLIPDRLLAFDAGLGLLIVKLTIVAAPLAMLPAPNDLVIVGGAYTLMEAVAARPLDALALVTGPVLLVLVPAATPTTMTVYAQVAPAGTVPPVSAKLDPPEAALRLPLQPAPV